MLIEEAKDVLNKNNIREDVYVINGDLSDESLCLLSSGEKWNVFYYEKGEQINKQIFESESDACEYFLNILLDDPTTRKK